VENSLQKRLWTCRQTDYRMNEFALHAIKWQDYRITESFSTVAPMLFVLNVWKRSPTVFWVSLSKQPMSKLYRARSITFRSARTSILPVDLGLIVDNAQHYRRGMVTNAIQQWTNSV
jgi:hypothetical protein